MSFAQSDYLLFLAAVLAIFPFLPKRGRVLGMLVASYAFYLTQIPIHGLLLAGATLLSYGCGIGMDRASSEQVRKRWLWLSLLGVVGALIVFKYSGLLARGWNGTLGIFGLEWRVPSWVLPLGISFYTFQVVGYILDVYRKRIKPCRDLLQYGLYVSFFPQLIAGPIERAEHLLPQLQRLRPAGLANLSVGMRRILWGLFKKGCLADRFRPILIEILMHPEGRDSLTLFLTGTGLLVVLYLDFSAYTDIARGSARLFGVELVENFHTPFAATSVSDFTRRWHVSLILWIENYLYSPLMKGRVTHAKIWRANLILAAVFGLWHGPYVSYVVAGTLLGVCIAAQHSWRLRAMHKGVRRVGGGLGGMVLGWVTTMGVWSLFVVCLFAASGSNTMAFYRELLAARIPRGEDWKFIGASLALLFVGWTVHVSAGRLDGNHLWTRLPTLGRALVWIALVWVIGARSISNPESFVYFRF